MLSEAASELMAAACIYRKSMSYVRQCLIFLAFRAIHRQNRRPLPLALNIGATQAFLPPPRPAMSSPMELQSKHILRHAAGAVAVARRRRDDGGRADDGRRGFCVCHARRPPAASHRDDKILSSLVVLGHKELMATPLYKSPHIHPAIKSTHFVLFAGALRLS